MVRCVPRVCLFGISLVSCQLAWLKESMTNSTALWKIVVTSVSATWSNGSHVCSTQVSNSFFGRKYIFTFELSVEKRLLTKGAHRQNSGANRAANAHACLISKRMRGWTRTFVEGLRTFNIFKVLSYVRLPAVPLLFCRQLSSLPVLNSLSAFSRHLPHPRCLL